MGWIIKETTYIQAPGHLIHPAGVHHRLGHFMDFITLKTERLLLRDHVPDDLPSHHLLLSDAKTMYYLPEIKTESIKQSKEDLDEAISDIGKALRTKYFLRMEDINTKELIGEIGYTVTAFTPLGKMVELGYFIHQKHWSKGYTTEALRELMHFAFAENDVYRISTGCLTENGGSEKVMIKCGMIKEANLKMKVYHDGKLKDRVEYRMLRDEWLAAHPA